MSSQKVEQQLYDIVHVLARGLMQLHEDFIAEFKRRGPDMLKGYAAAEDAWKRLHEERSGR